MKKYNYLILLLLVFFSMGCEVKIDTKAKDIKWDREVCQRCKMIISNRNYAVQIINPINGERFYFDDIGCMVVWFKEEKLSWEDKAIIYISDATTGEWLDAKEAYWVYGAITPMAFGFSAYKFEVKGKQNHKFSYVKEKILGSL